MAGYLTLISTTTLVEAILLAVVVLGLVGYKIYHRVTNVVGGIVNSTVTQGSYRIVELGKINDKFKFEDVEKEYRFEFEVETKEALKNFDYSEALYKLVKEKIFFFKDACRKAEYNAKLIDKYVEAVDGIYFNKKILIGEANTKQIPLGTYKKYEKAHFNQMMYKPTTEIMFHIDVKCKDPKVKPASTVYTTDDVRDVFGRIDREERKRPGKN